MSNDDAAQDQEVQAPENAAQAEGQRQTSTLRLRYDKAETNYANIAIVTSMPEEVIMNFGVNAMPPTPQREVNIEISQRVIMNYASAKRLAITLGNIIQRYEAARGVINVQPPSQPSPQPAPAPARGPEAESASGDN